jgi:leucyl aminopeptidase
MRRVFVLYNNRNIFFILQETTMSFQLKSGALPSGSAKKIATHFIIASQNDAQAAQICPATLSTLPAAIAAQITSAIASERFSAASGQHLSLIDDASHSQFILIGAGTPKDAASFSKAAGAAVSKHCKTYKISAATICLDSTTGTDTRAINHMVLGAADANYTFNAPYSIAGKKKNANPDKTQLTLWLSKSANAEQTSAFKNACAIAKGVALTKHLGDLPPNFATPEFLGDVAQDLAKQYDFSVQVLEKKQIAALKMNSFLSVAKGSTVPPRFIILEYKGGNPKDAPVVLVGKGITFDSGGISLKPGAGMDEMKYDMCGAASLLGTFKSIGEARPKINVVGLIAACENMPAGNASKPGDVVTTMAGLTIEILNTDAEGRLVLCDALTYAERYKPAAVVNMATLTGACVVALGHHHSGLFANNDELAAQLQAAGQNQSDTAWRMPIDEAYHEQLKSNFADMANIGGMPAGSVTAACFLSRFTQKYPWAHLDIAGTAWKSGANKGATGRPVALLSQFIFNRSSSK